MSKQQRNSDDLVNPLLEELKPLLKNIQKGIESHGLDGFNSKLQGLLESSDEKTEIIKSLFQIVCEEFKITKEQLFTTHARGAIKEAKYMCACIFHLECGFNIRFIGRHIFKNKQYGFVFIAIKKHKNLSEKVKVDREYKARYNKVLAALQTKISKNSKQ